MFKQAWFLCSVSLFFLWLLAACGPPTPSAGGASITVKNVDVDQARAGGDFVALFAGSTGPLSAGDRVRTSDRGEALLQLPCALLLIFGGSNLQMQEQSANGANFRATGSQLISSKCRNIQIANGEAVVQSVGTVFVYAYDANSHETLLWTQVGTAVLSTQQSDGSAGESMIVPSGYWSVKRGGNSPETARPVAEMRAVVQEMGLELVYAQVVQQLQTQGFGPSATVPTPIATILDETPTPTPTETPLATDTPTPTATTPRRLIPTPTATPTALVIFRADVTQIYAGQKTTLRWEVGNVRAVYLDGKGVVGRGSVGVAPPRTTTYTLHVVYKDGSSQDYTVTITVLETTPPVITNVISNVPPGMLGYVPANGCTATASFQATVTDNVGVSSVIFQYRYQINGSPVGRVGDRLMTLDPKNPDTYVVQFDVSSEAGPLFSGVNGEMAFDVIATDLAGNKSTSPTDYVGVHEKCQ